jgi:hypothetical protein
MEPGERVLYREAQPVGDPVLATDRGIYQQDGAAEADWHRLGWEEIHEVRWVPERGVLTLTSLVPRVSPGMALRLPSRSRLPRLVEERMATAVLATSHVRLPCGALARVCARRRPGTGEVSWVVMFGRGVDPDSSEVQAQLPAAIHHLRVQVGI